MFGTSACQKAYKLGHGNNPALGTKFLDLIDEVLLNIGSGEKPRMRALIKNWTWGSWITQSIQQWIIEPERRVSYLSLRDKARQWWYFLDLIQRRPDSNQAERSCV